MPFTEISLENFRSFRSLIFEPGRLTSIIGSNAAGKSNIIHAFVFIRDCARHGLANAISLQGGPSFLLNTRIGLQKPLVCSFAYLMEQPVAERISIPGTGEAEFIGRQISYRFALTFLEGCFQPRISEDQLTITGSLILNQEHSRGNSFPAEIRLNHLHDEIQAGLFLTGNDIPLTSIQKHLPDDTILMNAPVLFPGVPCMSLLFGSLRAYDFDPRLVKRAIPMASMHDLEENGQNLPVVLDSILKDPKKKNLFYTLIKDLLPFVDEVVIESYMGMNLFISIREIFDRNSTIPASSVSDGTILIANLIICLFFENSRVSIIEEPEKNLHPFLISRVAQLLKDASYNRQIIISTHNPGMVKSLEPASLLLVTRDEEGFSRAVRPLDKREVVAFLEQDIGIDELFVQNLLGMD
jgi:predicted ATPase